MKASEVQGFERLRQRHRNNPSGKWQPLSSLAERLPQRVVEVEIAPGCGHDINGGDDGCWERVEFGRGGNRVTDPEQQSRAGKASGKARREKGKQKGKKN